MRDSGERGAGRWGRLKAFVGVVAVAFAVTLGLAVANRLSEEALGVLAGAVCGVGAAIPTSLIVVAVSRRQSEGRSSGYSRIRDREEDYNFRHSYPPIVVVSPAGGEQRSGASWNALPSSLSAPAEREFRVVGGASVDREGVRYDHERCA
ncbi:MAG: hypothetical protein PVJ55_05145 [Anaerolineae bacterium]|jgi:hypothetical protein